MTINISKESIIEENVIIMDGVNILGKSRIKANTKIMPNSVIDNSCVGINCQIGPMAHIHGDSEIGDNCRIGNFVEVNRSKLCHNVKCAHLSYVGDAFINSNTNIGAGVIFCNYDGKNKNKTIIGEDCFVGSNTCLIAPLIIGNNCLIGAGSILSENLKDNTFFVTRAEKKIKPNKFKQ